MKKLCSVCGVEKLVEEFHFKNKKKGTYRDRCKTCAAEYHRQHYERNKATYIANAAAQREKLTQLLRELKDGPCVDCGHRYPWYVMQFDHVRGKKRADVAILVNKGSERKLLEEVEKCDLVCANCHAERTHGRVDCDGAYGPSKP